MTSSYVSVTKSISRKEFFQSDIQFNEFFQAKTENEGNEYMIQEIFGSHVFFL